MVKRCNEVIAECPICRIRTMPSEACITRERRASRHQPERSKWPKRIIKSVGELREVLMSLCSVEAVCTMRGGESGGENNGLRAAPTPALLAATNDEWSHLGIYRANERSDAERSADLGGADHEMRGSDFASINCVVVCRLHGIDNKGAATRCAPCSRERCPRLDRAYFA